MPKTKISEFDSTPANNTDIDSINIAEGCAPSGINNAIRELMAQLKDQQTGAGGDNFTVGGNLIVNGTSVHTGATTFTGAVTFSSSVVMSTALPVASGGTGASTAGNARTNLSAASSGANSDITSIAGLSTPLTVAQGGSGVTTSTGTGSTVLSASPTFTGIPLAPTATAGTNTTQIATTAFVTAVQQALYPVGSIYINASSSTNPNTLLGFGTWSAFGAGKVLVGLDAGDALFDTLEETGGSKDSVVVSHTHTATVTDPGHNHTADVNGLQSVALGGSSQTRSGGNTGTSVTGITVANSTTGVSGTNANLQPYITVRMWKRTA